VGQTFLSASQYGRQECLPHDDESVSEAGGIERISGIAGILSILRGRVRLRSFSELAKFAGRERTTG
jgi:hypothetical protein